MKSNKATASISAKIAAITLQYQEKVKSALVNDRAANKMSTLSDAKVSSQVTTLLVKAGADLNATIRPRIESAKEVLTPILKK